MYAEQILLDKGKNQWFVLFYVGREGWDPTVFNQHMSWFADNGVSVTPVAAMGDQEVLGNLYHVGFDSQVDPKLVAYTAAWENEDGTSLRPDQYQMLEWSWEGWINNQGPQEFAAWLESINSAN